MADTPEENDKLPEAEAEARFKRIVGNLVNTPHKPHKDEPAKRAKRADRAYFNLPFERIDGVSSLMRFRSLEPCAVGERPAFRGNDLRHGHEGAARLKPNSIPVTDVKLLCHG